MARKRAKSTNKRRSRPVRAGARRKAGVRGKPARRSAPPSRDALDDFIVAAARALDLPVEPAWRGAIRGNLEATLRLAALYADVPLPDEAEPAPVFTA